MNESLAEQIRKKMNPDEPFFRAAYSECADLVEARDAEIREHLEKLQSIVGFWTPAEIEELNAALALLDGQPQEGKRG